MNGKTLFALFASVVVAIFPSDPFPDSTSTGECGNYNGAPLDCDLFCGHASDCKECSEKPQCVWCEGSLDTAGGTYGVISTPGCVAADRVSFPYKCIGSTATKTTDCPGVLAWWEITLIVFGVLAGVTLIIVICLLRKIKRWIARKRTGESSTSSD